MFLLFAACVSRQLFAIGECLFTTRDSLSSATDQLYPFVPNSRVSKD